SINALERFIGDGGMKQKNPRPVIEKRKEKVSVIGAGPAGLSCAYFLARKGYGVTIYESASEPGGMLRYGIPAYRLPRRILDQEVERILSMGAEIRTGEMLESSDIEELGARGAVFIATGSWIETRPNIKGDGQGKIWAGLTFLRQVNGGYKPRIGRRVIVIGGGNTAVDSARTARRLGAKVTVLYRRAKEDMPAIPAEVEEAEREGVEFIFQAAPVEISGTYGMADGVRYARTRPGKPDASGRRTPVIVKGQTLSLKADAVILAVGETADLSLLPQRIETAGGLIAADPWGRTSRPGFFAGGDAATGDGYVSKAIASGRNAASAIHRYFNGETSEPRGDLREIVTSDKINLDYFSRQKRVKTAPVDVKKRKGTFKEVHPGLSAAQAKKEAQRCFSCGSCIQCNVCLMVCPDVAIYYSENEKEYRVDYDHCKGCGICAVECPRSAMSLEEEKWSE
ncbi:MAG TPA: FAD-dependent oxidoreductase, partial [Thermodesulfobacteriota bacterium]|nr:FAD-dependent oxidoreductase [Thermodesulfobacteriota bacterium]